MRVQERAVAIFYIQFFLIIASGSPLFLPAVTPLSIFIKPIPLSADIDSRYIEMKYKILE
ncbi:MAG: hypothetical protein A4E48_01473 [Methanosaeta sp. PtaU1.Bin060]|nr:MAG: hypothetical protein A4E48_01473 [Methanosaeta sp. PtaU1.Bin060]